jgi:hypothetical protein
MREMRPIFRLTSLPLKKIMYLLNSLNLIADRKNIGALTV